MYNLDKKCASVIGLYDDDDDFVRLSTEIWLKWERFLTCIRNFPSEMYDRNFDNPDGRFGLRLFSVLSRQVS